VPLQFVILRTASLVVELPILLGYGRVAERGSRLIPQGRLRAIQDGVAGTFVVAAGIGIANMRRP
jgi:threonine/homoserine/homoserine lactone efflux protein